MVYLKILLATDPDLAESRDGYLIRPLQESKSCSLHSTLYALRLTLHGLRSRHVIHSAGMEWVAFAQPHDSQSEALKTTVLVNGFATIGGTRRIKPATISQQRRECQLVNPNQYVEYSAHQSRPACPPRSSRRTQRLVLGLITIRSNESSCPSWLIIALHIGTNPPGRPAGSVPQPGRPT